MTPKEFKDLPPEEQEQIKKEAERIARGLPPLPPERPVAPKIDLKKKYFFDKRPKLPIVDDLKTTYEQLKKEEYQKLIDQIFTQAIAAQRPKAPPPMSPDEQEYHANVSTRMYNFLISGRNVQVGGVTFYPRDAQRFGQPDKVKLGQYFQSRYPSTPDPFKWWDDPRYAQPDDLPQPDPKEMAKVKPHIIIDNGTFQVITPFNGKFVNALKSSFEGKDRKWDARRKLWLVRNTEENVNKAKALIEKHFQTRAQMFSKQGDLHATATVAVDNTSKYAILGVEQDASPQEIKKAFYRIAKKLHSDLSDADDEFFIMAKKAYDTLKDPIKRKKYDLALRLMNHSSVGQDVGLKLTPKDLMT